METENKKERKDIGALWLKKSKDGATSYLSGSIRLPDGQQIKLAVFKNTYKSQSNHPDYKIYPDTREASATGTVAAKPSQPKPPTKAPAPTPAPVDLDADVDSDIPF